MSLWFTVTSNSNVLDYLQVLAQLTKNFNRMLPSVISEEDDEDDSDTEDDPAVGTEVKVSR